MNWYRCHCISALQYCTVALKMPPISFEDPGKLLPENIHLALRDNFYMKIGGEGKGNSTQYVHTALLEKHPIHVSIQRDMSPKYKKMRVRPFKVHVHKKVLALKKVSLSYLVFSSLVWVKEEENSEPIVVSSEKILLRSTSSERELPAPRESIMPAA